MLRKIFGTGVALLLVVGIAGAKDAKDAKKGEQGNVAFGKVVSLDVKDGVGTLTVMGSKARGEEPKEISFKITQHTKFVKGASRTNEGTAVEAAQVSETYKKDATVAVRFEGKGSDLTASRVNAVAPRLKPVTP